ncbi:MAG: cyanoexosortase A system-associated protein [Xenococcus sp. (in: cyanobacteria)]
MSPESKLRNAFLATISIGITLVTAYAIANPHVGNRQVADFDFPDEIPLTNWQQLSSESLVLPAKPDDNGEFIKSAKRYLYSKENLNLVLEIRYLVGTRGNISGLLKEYWELSPAIMAKQQVKTISGIGSYLFVEVENRNSTEKHISYLSSCLTSVGNSIAGQKEFSAVLSQVRLTPELIWHWLWGKESIRDRRCLWITLEIATQDQKLENNDKNLEQVWRELNHWGKPNFPQLN